MTAGVRFTIVVALLLSASRCVAAPRFWSVSPYAVRLLVVPTGPRLATPDYEAALERGLRERLNRGVRPLWRVTLELAPRDERQSTVASLATEPTPPEPPLPEGPKPDKTIFVTVAEDASGAAIAAREFDNALQRWGTTKTARVARLGEAPGAVVEAAVAAFAPLAAFDIDPDDPGRVTIAYRGAELITAGFGSANAGEVLVPFWRRVDREGNPVPDGVRRVPWTYLVAEEESDEAEAAARVYSHARVPFGTRRRGRIEQLALLVRRPEGSSTVLRLHDRNDPEVALAGYEVFASPPGSKALTRLGRSDSAGLIETPPDPAGGPIRMTHIKCGSSVVASLPIAVGVEPRLEIPLLDERKRLAAETKVAALREELVDLVARRRILAARIRKRLEAEDVAAAEELLAEVEGLPGLAQFNQRLGKAEQLYRAKDPAAQRRLDRLFTETRSVLGSALDARETRRLANEVLEARRAGG